MLQQNDGSCKSSVWSITLPQDWLMLLGHKFLSHHNLLSLCSHSAFKDMFIQLLQMHTFYEHLEFFKQKHNYESGDVTLSVAGALRLVWPFYDFFGSTTATPRCTIQSLRHPQTESENTSPAVASEAAYSLASPKAVNPEGVIALWDSPRQLSSKVSHRYTHMHTASAVTRQRTPLLVESVLRILDTKADSRLVLKIIKV